jgi:Cu/Ag efflux protein CusF
MSATDGKQSIFQEGDMKKYSVKFVALLLTSSVATAALAAEDQGGTAGTGSASPGTTAGTVAQSEGMESSGTGQSLQGQHTMQGTISEIDQGSGKLTLMTKDGMTLALHFPPDALKEYKTGDQLRVQLAISPQSGMTGAADSTGTGATDSPK